MSLAELTARVHQLEAEKATLLAQLSDNERELAQLSDELNETNQGVVALYAELDDKANQLKEASELKSRFLSYMSHEFRTPLGSIRSIVRLLLDRLDGPLTEEQEKQVHFVQQSAIELNNMVDDLLDLAKIEAGRVSISAAWFEMVDLFAALRGMFKPLLADSDVTLILEEPSDIPRIYTDDKKLSHILRNYISNALKFTPHGEVRVSVCRGDADQVKFVVADTGIGVAPEHLAHIFEDFAQIDSPLQRKFRGTGLGLALCKKLAHVLGGTVDVRSEVGAGSVFSVSIPIQYGGAQTQDARIAPLASAGPQ